MKKRILMTLLVLFSCSTVFAEAEQKNNEGDQAAPGAIGPRKMIMRTTDPAVGQGAMKNTKMTAPASQPVAPAGTVGKPAGNTNTISTGTITTDKPKVALRGKTTVNPQDANSGQPLPQTGRLNSASESDTLGGPAEKTNYKNINKRSADLSGQSF